MRIAISGTACQGKSTLIKDFLDQWPMYTTPTKTYRDVIVEKSLSHSSVTNKDTQWEILNFMIDELKKLLKGIKLYLIAVLLTISYTVYGLNKKKNLILIMNL